MDTSVSICYVAKSKKNYEYQRRKRWFIKEKNQDTFIISASSKTTKENEHNGLVSSIKSQIKT